MEKLDIVVIILFFFVLFSMFFTLIKINKFMPVFETCEDDLEIFAKCQCIPCSWENHEEINGENSCIDYDK